MKIIDILGKMLENHSLFHLINLYGNDKYLERMIEITVYFHLKMNYFT